MSKGNDDFLDDDDFEEESEDDTGGNAASGSDENAKQAPDARRRVEDRLEEIRLKRILDDYDFDLD
ncbi:MAG: PA3496 family putative envelope integrity protein [bacterium]